MIVAVTKVAAARTVTAAAAAAAPLQAVEAQP
jgi:hypothetical protein